MRGIAGLLGDERGATAVEYALLAALIAVVAIAGFNALGAAVDGLYTKIVANVT